MGPDRPAGVPGADGPHTDDARQLTDAPVPAWGVRDAAIGFLIAVVASAMVSSLVLVATDNVDTPGDLSLVWVAVLQLPLWVGLLGMPLWATIRKGNGPVRDLGLRMRGRDVPVGLAIGVACQLVLVPLIYYPIIELTSLDTADLEEPARELTDKATDPLTVALLVVIVGIGAPLVEEIFYRGLLQGALLWRGVAPLLAVTISAAVFGISHFQLIQLPALFVFGFVLGELAFRSDRLGPAIWAHVGFNMITVVALLAS